MNELKRIFNECVAVYSCNIPKEEAVLRIMRKIMIERQGNASAQIDHHTINLAQANYEELRTLDNNLYHQFNPATGGRR